jgi:hypothetical protein
MVLLSSVDYGQIASLPRGKDARSSFRVALLRSEVRNGLSNLTGHVYDQEGKENNKLTDYILSTTRTS